MKTVVTQELRPLLKSRTTKKEVSEVIEDEGYLKSVEFSQVQDTPTTLSGYGITDATTSIKLNGSTYTPSSGVIDAGIQPYGELIIGAQTTTTASWVGTSKLSTATDFVSGYRFTYWLPYNGVSGTNATLTLTFQDNTTKSLDIYYKGTARCTTHFGGGSKIDFVYLENAIIGGTAYTGCWPDADYNSDTTNSYSTRSYYEVSRLYSNSAPLYRYKLCGYHDGCIVPVVITNQSNATQVNKAPTTIGLDVIRGITYYNTTTSKTTNKSAITNALQENMYINSASYTFNESVPVYCDIFLVGKSFDGQYLYLDDTKTGTAYKSYYCFAEKGSSDNAALTADYFAHFVAGKYYWFVGSSYSSANYYQLKINNPLFYYDGTSLIPVAIGMAEASKAILLPTSAPASPQAGKAYMYYDETNHQICVRESNGDVYKITLTT